MAAARDPLTSEAIAQLAALVAFDTTSRNSNLPLLDYVEEQLRPLGARLERIWDQTGAKANLMASFGPVEQSGGIILSGHTDVVPVDGQPWSTDPWVLTEADGLLYGRGTCDMKGYSACILALAPKLAAADLKRPVHIALSYDEEVGCVGAVSMVEHMARTLPGIEGVFVGEPTDMKVVSGHKGISTFVVEITGREAHSSRIDQGVSAIMEAVPLMALVCQLAQGAQARLPAGSLFEPPGTTMTIGLVEGGTAVNILARQASFIFDIRHEQPGELAPMLEQVRQAVARADASIKERAPEGGAVIRQRSGSPPLVPDTTSLAERTARLLTGDNEVRAVGYATEGGLFQQAGLPTVVCGPGSILQAHQPDEFVPVDQLTACLRFLDGLIARQCD
jgi:acetylornithine deacetylase